jgi:hypothetical protein
MVYTRKRRVRHKKTQRRTKRKYTIKRVRGGNSNNRIPSETLAEYEFRRWHSFIDKINNVKTENEEFDMIYNLYKYLQSTDELFKQPYIRAYVKSDIQSHIQFLPQYLRNEAQNVLNYISRFEPLNDPNPLVYNRKWNDYNINNDPHSRNNNGSLNNNIRNNININNNRNNNNNNNNNFEEYNINTMLDT